MVRHVTDAHTAPLPAILEIPSKVKRIWIEILVNVALLKVVALFVYGFSF